MKLRDLPTDKTFIIDGDTKKFLYRRINLNETDNVIRKEMGVNSCDIEVITLDLDEEIL